MRCPHCNRETPDDASSCIVCRRALLRRSHSAEFASAATQILSERARPIIRHRRRTRTCRRGIYSDSRYRVERLLGAGGMGAVYEAWDQELGLAVALKVIRPDIIGSPGIAHDFGQRFKQELLMARSVTHRNVTRIHDLGDVGGVKYITMQFIEGATLAESLSRARSPSSVCGACQTTGVGDSGGA